MDNAEKLLKAFIEASGFEIKEIQIPIDARVSPVGVSFTPAIDYKVTKKKVDPLFIDWEPATAIREGEIITFIDGIRYKMTDGIMVEVTDGIQLNLNDPQKIYNKSLSDIFDRAQLNKDIALPDFIENLGYEVGALVSHNDKYYKSLFGKGYNLNYEPLSDPCAWAECVNETKI
jgi:hypothetical protein